MNDFTEVLSEHQSLARGLPADTPHAPPPRSAWRSRLIHGLQDLIDADEDEQQEVFNKTMHAVFDSEDYPSRLGGPLGVIYVGEWMEDVIAQNPGLAGYAVMQSEKSIGFLEAAGAVLKQNIKAPVPFEIDHGTPQTLKKKKKPNIQTTLTLNGTSSSVFKFLEKTMKNMERRRADLEKAQAKAREKNAHAQESTSNSASRGKDREYLGKSKRPTSPELSDVVDEDDDDFVDKTTGIGALGMNLNPNRLLRQNLNPNRLLRQNLNPNSETESEDAPHLSLKVKGKRKAVTDDEESDEEVVEPPRKCPAKESEHTKVPDSEPETPTRNKGTRANRPWSMTPEQPLPLSPEKLPSKPSGPTFGSIGFWNPRVSTTVVEKGVTRKIWCFRCHRWADHFATTS